MHDGVNAFLSDGQQYIVDAARLLVMGGREPCLATFYVGAMEADDGEVAHTRASKTGPPLSQLPHRQEICFDKTGYVDDVELLTVAAEQALAKYEEQVARRTAVPEDDDADGALFLPEPEGESEEDVWAGAGLNEGESGASGPRVMRASRASASAMCCHVCVPRFVDVLFGERRRWAVEGM